MDKANKMEQIKKSKNDIVYSFCHNNYDALPSFSRDIYPNQEDVLQSDIIDLHKKYIATGENEGQLHIYENNKCIITGEDLNTIISKEYTIDDYYNLLDVINYRKLIPNKFSNESISVLNNLQSIVKENPFGANNYLQSFLEELIKSDTIENTNKLWEDLNTQLIVEIENVQKLFSEVLGDEVSNNVYSNLVKLGLLQNINEDNINRYGETYANNELFNTQLTLLKKYIYSDLFGTINKIKNNKDVILT